MRLLCAPSLLFFSAVLGLHFFSAGCYNATAPPLVGTTLQILRLCWVIMLLCWVLDATAPSLLVATASLLGVRCYCFSAKCCGVRLFSVEYSAAVLLLCYSFSLLLLNCFCFNFCDFFQLSLKMFHIFFLV